MRFPISVITILLLTSACQKSPTRTTDVDDGEMDILYLFSFEDSSDTSGWWGLYPQFFEQDEEAPCGEQVLHIGGGCLQPAAYFQTEFDAPTGNYKLGAFLKTISAGPEITFKLTGSPHDENRISIAPIDTVWRYYESPDPLYVQEGDSVEIQIWIGGYAPQFGYADCIEVFRAD